MLISDWSSDVCSSDLLSTPLSCFFRPFPGTTPRCRGRMFRTDAASMRRVTRARHLSCSKKHMKQGVFREVHVGGRERFETQPRMSHASSACPQRRSEEHTSELQSLMRISYAVFCLKK